MTNISSFIESGILESYVLGTATDAEIAAVEAMSVSHYEVRKEIEEISNALEQYAFANAVEPNPTIKTFLMATLDYTARMESGEQPAFPAELQTGSSIQDYAEWLNRPDMVLPEGFTDAYAKIIGYTPTAVTAIVWIKDMAPQEVHHDEFEKFLIVEGSCDITIGDEVHHLVAGNYMAIPLHANHSLKITSSIPCKVILQRIAA